MEEMKNFISPISFETNVPDAIRTLNPKSFEEKLYLVLYTRTDEDSNGFLLCEGRFDCYASIDRLLNTYPIDIHNSVVLVEVPAVNRHGEGEWMFKNIDKASSVYQFCKAVEMFFPNIDLNIEDYNSSNIEPDNDPEPVAITEQDLRSYSPISKSDSEVVNAYRDMIKESKEENIE